MILFDDVWFEYEPGQPVLRNLSLQLQPGETVALNGIVMVYIGENCPDYSDAHGIENYQILCLHALMRQLCHH